MGKLLMKINKLIKEIKGVFVLPKKQYYFGKLVHGTPYFWPINFNKNIITIRKLKLRSEEERIEYIEQFPHLKHNNRIKFSNLPIVRRSKSWIVKIFNNYYFIEIGWPIAVKMIDLGWKEKYGSPRYEWSPMFQINFFHWQFCMIWFAPDYDNDLYYEMILWYLFYADKDINKAKNTWEWIDGDTKLSTWNDEYLIKNK
jgi:hypothetical protein